MRRLFVLLFVIGLLAGCEQASKERYGSGVIIFRSGQSTTCDEGITLVKPYFGVADGAGARTYICHQRDGDANFSAFDISTIKWLK